LSSQNGFAHRLASNNRSAQENCELIFLTIYGRVATTAELEVAVAHVSRIAMADGSEKDERYRDLIWALLASNEFMFVQ